MGHGEYILDRGKELELQLTAPITIVASSEYIDALEASAGANWISDANFIAVDPGEAIPEAKVNTSGIIVFEVDPTVPRSMERIRKLHAIRPGMPQIVAMKNVDLKLVRTLVREGVADVVELPFAAEEILQTVVAVLETKGHAAEQEVELAPVIAVTRAVGGSGATTIASHLAASLADDDARPRVCIFDLDIQSGRLAEVLGITPRRTLSDLLEAGKRIDASLMQSVAERHASGVSVIAAPGEIIPIEAVKAEDLARILEIARNEYDYVVLDLPSNLTNWTLNVLSKADSVVMVVEQTLASLRQARRRLDLFKNLGLDHRLISIVVNKTERKLFSAISLGDVEKALGRPVTAGIALDSATLASAQDQGVLARSIKRKSAFVSDLEGLAETIAAAVEGAHR
ncbi:CpaE family protein [Qipengyuania sp. RANM35]|uniref:AAA family ATPase n=1 Tax=Qipengyuania sp. RANM35 TaxID=3068635 RepID=UPI0034DB29A1